MTIINGDHGKKKDESSLVDLVDEKPQNTKTCAVCKASFGAFTRRRVCPLCNQYVCNKCGQFPVPLEAPATGSVDVCKRCCIIMKRRIIYNQKLKEQKANFTASNLNVMYNTNIALRQKIIGLMPSFRGLVYSLTGSVDTTQLDIATLYDLKTEAKNTQQSLDRCFANFEKRLKKIADIDVTSTTDEKLKKHIRIAMANFLQENLLEFKLLIQQLDGFLGSPATVQKFNNYSELKKKEDTNKEMQQRLEKYQQSKQKKKEN